MLKKIFLPIFFAAILLSGTSMVSMHPEADQQAADDSLVHYPMEKHFKHVTQLTFGGDNAEAYFSFDNKKIVFQATNEKWNAACDQVFYSALDNFSPALLSTGKGRT